MRDNPLASFAGVFRWTRFSLVLLGAFLATVLLICLIWQPLFTDYIRWLAQDRMFWARFDWLLVSVFAAMVVLIMAGADLRADVRIVLVGFAGGLAIESWGTQTNLWTYFTHERPPLWIIPAWPIASLAIDRLSRSLDWIANRRLSQGAARRFFSWCYWIVFPGFILLMLSFVWPTINRSLTVAVLGLCLYLTAVPGDKRAAVLNFMAGSGLGYFLERWGTTRLCWTYYTQQTPPLFAVLAHGMAAVAFFRGVEALRRLRPRLKFIAARFQPD